MTPTRDKIGRVGAKPGRGFSLLEVTVLLAIIGVFAAGASRFFLSNLKANRHVGSVNDLEAIKRDFLSEVDCSKNLTSLAQCAQPQTYNYFLKASDGTNLLAGTYGALGEWNFRWYCDPGAGLIIEKASLEGHANATSPDKFVRDPMTLQEKRWSPLFDTGFAICPVPVPSGTNPTATFGLDHYRMSGGLSAGVTPQSCGPDGKGTIYSAEVACPTSAPDYLFAAGGGAYCQGNTGGAMVLASYPVEKAGYPPVSAWHIDCCAEKAPPANASAWAECVRVPPVPPSKPSRRVVLFQSLVRDPSATTATDCAPGLPPPTPCPGTCPTQCCPTCAVQCPTACPQICPPPPPKGVHWTADITCPQNSVATGGGAQCAFAPNGGTLQLSTSTNGTTWHADCCVYDSQYSVPPYGVTQPIPLAASAVCLYAPPPPPPTTTGGP